MNRPMIFAAGVAATLAFGALWHGPFGTGAEFAERADTLARKTLDHYEMTAVSARLERSPLSRTMILSGPADDFQRSELVRILSDVPGVAEVRWDPASLPHERGQN